ncbi:MAG: hypothetical protein ACYTGN_14755 [Planctomycetota bacterium]
MTAALATVLEVVGVEGWSLTVGAWARDAVDIQIGDHYYFVEAVPGRFWLASLALAALIGAALPRFSLVGAVAVVGSTLHSLVVVTTLFGGVRIYEVRYGGAWIASAVSALALMAATLVAWSRRARRAVPPTRPDPSASDTDPNAA